MDDDGGEGYLEWVDVAPQIEMLYADTTNQSREAQEWHSVTLTDDVDGG